MAALRIGSRVAEGRSVSLDIAARARWAKPVFAISALALVLTGCGLFRYETRAPWRGEAEAACLASKQVKPGVHIVPASSLDGPGACGMDYPFRVTAFADGAVALDQRQTFACPMIPRADAWIDEVVQPAAEMVFGQPVVEMRAGSYACRGQNNQSGARLSEHSFGNALDIMAFRLADGRLITVAQGWKGAPLEQEFLREVFLGACRHFTTVLGPGSDAFHYDHLHMDLARHDPAGTRRICKPVLKFTSRLDVAGGGFAPAATRPVQTTGPLPPVQPAPAPGWTARPLPAPVTTAPQPLRPQPLRPYSNTLPRPPGEIGVLTGSGLY
jgi:hypothetical protein